MHSYSVPCRCYVRALECAMQCTKPEISAWSIQMAVCQFARLPDCQIVHLSICPDRISPRSDSKIPQIRSRKNSHSHSHSAHAVLRSPFSDCCSAEAHCAVRAPQPPQQPPQKTASGVSLHASPTRFSCAACAACARLDPAGPGRTRQDLAFCVLLLLLLPLLLLLLSTSLRRRRFTSLEPALYNFHGQACLSTSWRLGYYLQRPSTFATLCRYIHIPVNHSSVATLQYISAISLTQSLLCRYQTLSRYFAYIP